MPAASQLGFRKQQERGEPGKGAAAISVSCGFIFLQPISQFPEEEDAVSVTCFNSKQTLVP